MSDPMNITKTLMDASAYEVDGKVILLSATGSRAYYGTDTPDSDYDFRGVYMASLPRVLSMAGARQSLAMTSPHDAVVYELSHFCKLAAAANPTALELLWAPKRWDTKTGMLLWTHKELFLSKLIVRTYGGYALSQLKKAREGTGGSRGATHHQRTKFKLHTLRLLDAGVAALETGEVQVKVPDPQKLREQALGDFEYIEALAQQKMAAMDRAACSSALPDRPDENAINQLIYEMRTNV